MTLFVLTPFVTQAFLNRISLKNWRADKIMLFLWAAPCGSGFPLYLRALLPRAQRMPLQSLPQKIGDKNLRTLESTCFYTILV